MEKEKIIEEIKKIIIHSLSSSSEGYKIFLFGSQAKGDARETSDIDIGILGEQKIPWNVMANILHHAEEIPTLRSIDILDFNAVEKRFRDNALERARIISDTSR